MIDMHSHFFPLITQQEAAAFAERIHRDVYQDFMTQVLAILDALYLASYLVVPPAWLAAWLEERL